MKTQKGMTMKATVVKNTRISEKFGYLELKCPDIAKEKNAGRFFMISPHSDNVYITDTLLKRPFAICDITSEETFTCLYMITGRGTKILSEALPGNNFLVTGPIGNFFRFEKDASVALIAGGIGLAPMINSARKLKEMGIKVTLYYGGRSKNDILMYDFLQSICNELFITTDDGSLGIHGNVLVPLKENIQNYKKIYACGPNRMLQAVTDLCSQNNIPIDVSLDEQMGCGVGACLGCIITINENGEKVKRRCCVEGPIFDGTKVDWDSLIR